VTRGELIAELAASLGLAHEARFIVEEVLGPAPAPADQVVAVADIDTARQLAVRRRGGEPLQYIFGHWAFRHLDLVVDGRVLIPRPETEQVVEVALDELRRLAPAAPTIVDAGTGSGAIALSMATELATQFPSGQLWATDSSPDALAVAGTNFDRVRRCTAAILPVTFLSGSWLSPLPPALQGAVDLIVANPPYVALAEWADLDDEVRREPVTALVAGPASDGTPGLGDVEELLLQARSWLARPGVAVVELAPQQAEAAGRLARAIGYVDVSVAPDLARRPRALVVRAP
jgi:release factor glutamine methyltransferase